MKVFIEPAPPLRHRYEKFKCFECGETFWEEKWAARGSERHYCNHECQYANFSKIVSPVIRHSNINRQVEGDPISRHLRRDYALTVEEFDEIPGLESLN